MKSIPHESLDSANGHPTSALLESSYLDFLRDKVAFTYRSGFDIGLDEINPLLYPFQRQIVQWAVAGGKRALFESFGLGKTFQQVEIVRIIQQRAGGAALIVLPLGVRQEFMRDGCTLGVQFTFSRTNDEFERAYAAGARHFLTNYESIRDGKLDPSRFTVVSLDEASCLRSYGSKTFQTFLTLFETVPYRYVATATPSPNRFKELIHYAGFLGIMDTGQALTRWFQRDSSQANNLTLYPHKEREFWIWLHSWAVFVSHPEQICSCDCHRSDYASKR